MKIKNYVKGGRVTWPTFGIMGPLHISRTVWARNFKFGTGGTNEEHEKIGQRGSGRAIVIYFRNFGTPPYLGNGLSVEIWNLASRQNTGGTNDTKNRSNGVGKGSREILLKFWDDSLFWERFELETSNLACILTTRGTNDEN